MPNDVSQQLSYADLESENASLKRQLAWFKKQLFGTKSERRLVEVSPDQLLLNGYCQLNGHSAIIPQ